MAEVERDATEGWKVERGSDQVERFGTPILGVPVTAEPEDNETSPDEDDAPDATERAEELATELDVDLAEVDGSGDHGRITADDVRDAADDS
jgi:pyruvate/2-oxoglutarate dehydrogenase complex dihydrolipoamide acyltransferase (E2) component